MSTDKEPVREEGQEEETLEPEPEPEPQEETRAKPCKCKYCGATAFSDGRPFKDWTDLGMHVRNDCREYARMKAEGKIKKPSERRVPTLQPKGLGAQAEEAAPQRRAPPEEFEPSDENEVLTQFITEYTDLTEQQQRVITQWAKLQGFIHPTTLASILIDECGLKAPKASMIASKYAVALSKFQQEKAQRPRFMGAYYGPPTGGGQLQPPLIYVPGSGQPQPPGYPGGYGQGYGQGYGPQGYPPQPPSADDIARRVKEELERGFDRRLEKIEDRMNQPAPQSSSEQYIEEYEPVLEDGKIVRDTNGEVVLKKTVKPLSAARGGGSEEIYKVLFQLERERGKDREKDEPLTEEKIKNLIREITDATKAPMTEERIRIIIKEATAEKPLSEATVAQIVKTALEDRDKGRPQEDPRLTELANDLKASKERLEDMGKKMDEKDKQALHDKIDGLNTSLENMRTDIRNMPTGEWKSDELKALTQGLHEVKEFLDKRKPIDTLLEKGPKAIRAIQLAPPLGEEEVEEPPPVEAKAPAAVEIPPAQDEVTQELRKHNYTVRLK